MTLPGTLLTHPTSGSGVDRSNSRLRKDLLTRLVHHQSHSKPNKTTCSASSDPVAMQASLSSTRSFLSKRKMRSFHRKDKSRDSITTVCQAVVDPAEATWKEEKQVVEQIPVEGKEKLPAVSSDPSYTQEGIESVEDEMVTTIKRLSLFRGLPDYCGDSESNGNLIDHDFMQQAFGITMDGSRSESGQHFELSTTTRGDFLFSPMSDETFEMDVPIHLARERRPDLQVAIPANKSRIEIGTAVKVVDIGRRPSEAPSAISPPSTSTGTMPGRQFNGQFSVVSPLSIVEMPKPRRPFSALSLEGLTANTPPTKSATSNSSEDISERDGRSSSNGHSPRSSMSSVASNTATATATATATTIVKVQDGRRPSLPISEAQPIEADGHALAPKLPNLRSTPSLTKSSPMKTLKSKSSVASIKSIVSTINKNKPLPPEPGQINIAPLNVYGPPSRSSTMTIRPRGPASQGNKVETSVGPPPNVSRRPSHGSASLRSKYTPKDLDALDDAFQKTGPPKHHAAYSSNSTPTLSQVTLALENQLDTIKEDSPNHSVVVSLVNDPLQISRGPMRMEPSRRPPPPPGRSESPFHDKKESRRRMMKRSASSNHVAQQIRGGDGGPRRASTAVVGSSNKANRILGKSGMDNTTPVRMERKDSIDSSWSSNESPHMYGNASSPEMSDESPTPESEMSSIPDAHFEEIRKRLELLSPKDDPSQTFEAFHQRNASRSAEKLQNINRITVQTSREHVLSPCHSKDLKVPEHVAELEAYRSPSPVELEDTQRPLPAELGPPSPVPPPLQSPSESDIHPLERRGRKDALSPPQSTNSAKIRSMHSQRSAKARSLASIAMSEIPDIYAALPSSETRQRPSMTAEEVEQLISADAAERVLLRILESLENLKDLFAAAWVSRGFYRTFKRHELHLIKNALWSMSPAAWELREMSIPFMELTDGATDYKPAMYLHHYERDLLTMIQLKGMILEYCKSFLRAETISGLAGETARSSFIDDAFWRVWTFCRIFGCGKGREDDIVGQMDWLRGGILAKQQSTDRNTFANNDGVAMNSVLYNPPAGFARGNTGGLTADELFDMMEIWNCLGVLVQGYQGKRREAREYGIFDKSNVADGDVEKENATIEEWTYHLLTLAPSTVLDVSSPASPTQTAFAQVRSRGYTSWVPPTYGASRSTFFKEAANRVYDEKKPFRQRPSLSSASSFSTLPQVASKSSPPPKSFNESSDPTLASRQRVAGHAAELRAKKSDPNYKDVPISEERPMSNYPEVLARLEALSTSSTSAPPMPKIPSLASKFSLRKPKVIISSPSSKAAKISSPTTPTGSPSRKFANRFRSSKENLPISSRSESPARPLSPAEKLPLHPNAYPGPAVPYGPQVRDPVDVAVERLTRMGFEESRAKKALAETDSGNSIDFEKALSMLVKERERKKCLNRLDRMG